jgi:hypothetical protein
MSPSYDTLNTPWRLWALALGLCLCVSCGSPSESQEINDIDDVAGELPGASSPSLRVLKCGGFGLTHLPICLTAILWLSG